MTLVDQDNNCFGCLYGKIEILDLICAWILGIWIELKLLSYPLNQGLLDEIKKKDLEFFFYF